jgi:hypothetical protein
MLLDPLNSSMTTTLSKLDTLGALITYATVANDWLARFFKPATPTGDVTPKNALEAMAGIRGLPLAPTSAALSAPGRRLRTGSGVRACRSGWQPALQ